MSRGIRCYLLSAKVTNSKMKYHHTTSFLKVTGSISPAHAFCQPVSVLMHAIGVHARFEAGPFSGYSESF